MFRIGIGHDTHRLVEGRPLILGGVTIEADRGAEGHSDADALVHAIADAILGAMGDGDIGMHFPDKDSQWKGADSLHLLARVMWLVRERGMRVVNIDSNILLERPKLRSYIQTMRENLANIISIDAGLISIKAKTGEGMDAVGMGEAITAQAVVLMEQGVKLI
jgi:2-C-methyl-D-erythritol 2,4-cyclodiphosphate synthase